MSPSHVAILALGGTIASRPAGDQLARPELTAEDLAAALPYGQAVRIPGQHMSAVAQPDLGQAIAAFLAEA